MRVKIAVIGGGHIGSVLGLALLNEGYDASIFTEHDPEQLRNGRVLSSQCIWGTAGTIEQKCAPVFWSNHYAGIGGFRVRVVDRHTSALRHDFAASLEASGNSVDQRVKVAFWLEEFQRRGGDLVVTRISSDDLANIAERFDLVVVCAGKFRGDLGDLFPRDSEKSRYATVQRIGSVVYLDGRAQQHSNGCFAASEEWSIVPGVGDFFAIPAYSRGGACHVVCMEGFVGGPLDRFGGVKDTQEILRLTRELFERWLPWEAGRWSHATLTDDRAAICGGFTPTIRRPVAQLATGRSVMAFGDAHILMDPLTAQGANTHLKNVGFLLDCIESAGKCFSREWMAATTDEIWRRSRGIEAVQEQYLNPRAHIWDVFRAAERSPDFARWWLNAHFDRPHALLPWIEDAHATLRFISCFARETVG